MAEGESKNFERATSSQIVNPEDVRFLYVLEGKDPNIKIDREKIQTAQKFQDERANFLVTNFKDVENEVIGKKEKVSKAKGQIKYAVQSRMRNYQTDSAEVKADAIRETLSEPIAQYEKSWNEAIIKYFKQKKEIVNDPAKEQELRDDFVAYRDNLAAQIDLTVILANSYLDVMAGPDKYFNGEEIQKMVSEGSFRVSNITDMLIEKNEEETNDLKNKDLLDAFLYASAKNGNKEKTFETLSARLREQNNMVTNFVFTIIGFLSRDEKVEFATTYLKKYYQSESQLCRSQFLDIGMEKGIFSITEIEEILENTYGKGVFDQLYSSADKQEAIQKYESAHQITQAMREVENEPYSSKSATGKMLTIKNTALFLAQAAAVTTFGANVATNIWQGGHFINPLNLLSHPYIRGAGVVYGAAHIIKKPETFGETFATKDTRDAAKTATELIKLENLMDYPNWRDIKDYFEQKEFSGGKTFQDYVDDQKVKYGTDLSKIKFSKEGYIAYLESQLHVPEKKRSEVDYSALKTQTESLIVSDEFITTCAKVFDTFKFTNEKDFSNKIKEAKQI